MADRSVLENFRLTVFRAVAAQRSFRRAAEELYLTQPAITQQIKSLETELGTSLFDRRAREVTLTPAGELLLRHVHASQTILLRAQAEVAGLAGAVGGPLRLAVSTTIAQYILPPMLGRFVARYPAVELRMRTDNTEAVAAAIFSGEAELGLVEGPVHRPELKLEPWLQDRLVLAVPSAHPWLGAGRVGLDDLLKAPLLLRERGSGTREIVEAAIRAARERSGAAATAIVPTMELNSTEALLACVEVGLGVGFCSRAALRRQVRLGTLGVVRVTELRIARELSFVTLRGADAQGNAAVLLAFLREQAAHSKTG